MTAFQMEITQMKLIEEKQPIYNNKICNCLEPIGDGSFGRVYKTRNGVVKIQRNPLVDFNDSVDYEGIRETSILQILKHPNIISVNSFDLINGSIHIHMDSGNTYYKMNRKNLFSSNWYIADFIGQLTCAIHYMHIMGMAHRDIKPGNIIRIGKHWKLIDMGAAWISSYDITDVDTPNEFTTLWYRSPEKFVKEYSGFDYFPGDIWSLAISIIELLFDLDDIACETDDEQLKASKILNIKKRHPNINADLLDLLDRMLCIEPEKRITAKEILLHKFITKHFIVNNPINKLQPRSLFKNVLTKIPLNIPYSKRRHLLEWIHSLALYNNVRTITLLTSFILVDVILSIRKIKNIKLLGCVCLQLASACYDSSRIDVNNWLILSHDAFTLKEFEKEMKEIFSLLNYNVIFPSIFYVRSYLHKQSNVYIKLFRDVFCLLFSSDICAIRDIRKSMKTASEITKNLIETSFQYSADSESTNNSIYCYENLSLSVNYIKIPDPLEIYRQTEYAHILNNITKILSNIH